MGETELFGMTAQEAMRYVNDWAGVALTAVIMLGLVIGIAKNAIWGDKDPPKWGR